MKHFRFRTNWLGQLVLQANYARFTKRGDREYFWQDATVNDLENYYEQLCQLQNPCAGQKLTGL
jgi:hypothetical protein